MYIAKDGVKTGWWDSLSKLSWGNSTTIWGILMVVGVLLFAWAAFTAWKTCTNDMHRTLIIGGFGLSMISLIAVFALVFRRQSTGERDVRDFTTKNLGSAAWVAVLAAVIGFALLYPMWQNQAARIAMIPYLVFIVALVILLWDMKGKNEHRRYADAGHHHVGGSHAV